MSAYALTVAQQNPDLVKPWYSTPMTAYFNAGNDAEAWAEHFGGEVERHGAGYRVVNDSR